MPTSTPLLFRAVGDICPGDKEVLGLGVCSTTKRRGVGFPFAPIALLIRGADVVVGNLEGLLSSRMESITRPSVTFCGEPAVATELRRIGFTGLTVANNHVFEHGRSYFSETVAILQEAGLEVFGLRDQSGHFYCRPVVVKSRGLKIGLLAYNWVSVKLFPEADSFIAQVHDSIVNYTWNRTPNADHYRRQHPWECDKLVLGDIRKLKSEVDYVVVMPHWGFEFVHVPPYGCVLEGRAFVDAGADLVVATHPHVVQGHERYGHGHIFYSLGNFLFDMWHPASRRGAVLTCTLGGSAHGDFRIAFTKQTTSCEILEASSDDIAVMERILAASNAAIGSADNQQELDDDRIYRAFEQSYRRRKMSVIMRHLLLSFKYPFLATVVAAKVRGFTAMVYSRLQGNRFRW